MIQNGIGVFTALTLLSSAAAYAGSAPRELYGKSITIFWFESRTQSGPQEGGLRNPEIALYISTEGRIFSRLRVAIAPRNGFSGVKALHSASAEQGPETSGAKVGNTEFAGHSLIMTSLFESGARRISVEFDDGFTSCKAKILYGKESGQRTTRQTSMFSGQGEEVGAIQMSGVGCSIREGNIFTES
jgi:hypothetical protein